MSLRRNAGAEREPASSDFITGSKLQPLHQGPRSPLELIHISREFFPDVSLGLVNLIQCLKHFYFYYMMIK